MSFLPPRFRSALGRSVRTVLIQEPLIRLTAFRKPFASILTYHRIAPELPPLGSFAPNRTLLVRQEEFAKQVRFLKSHYRCISLPTLVAELSAGKLVRGSVVLTFDDGYRDNLTHALPILEEHGVPATIFIASGLIDGVLQPWWYELEHILRHQSELDVVIDEKPVRRNTVLALEKARTFGIVHASLKHAPLKEQARIMRALREQCPTPAPREGVLSWDEIRFLNAHPLLTIGCHTHLHSVLSRESTEEAREDIRHARERLAAELKSSVEMLAYPFGGAKDVGTREFELAGELGLQASVTMRSGYVLDEDRERLQSLPRISISDIDSMTTFRWKISGWSPGLYRRSNGWASLK